MSTLFSCSLFYLSFIPLWLSVIFIDLKSIFFDKTPNYLTEYISIACILFFTVLSIVVLWLEMYKYKRIGVHEHTIIDVQEEKTITAEFLLSYILPLFAFDFTNWDGVILFLIFFFILAFLCVKHNFFSVNIALECVKYRVYNCILRNEDGIETTQIVISRKRLNGCKGEMIYLKFLNNEYGLCIE